jgi:hypothetical protein
MRSIFILALLAGCAKGDATDETTDTGSTDSGSTDSGETAVESIFPAAGIWDVTAVEMLEDGCELDDGQGNGNGEPEGQLVITEIEEGSYTIKAAEFLAPWTCAVEGASLVCETQSFDQDLSGNGLDAVVTQTFPFGMVLSDTLTGSLTWGVTMSCVGVDCTNLETSFPCTSSFSASAAFASEAPAPE